MHEEQVAEGGLSDSRSSFLPQRSGGHRAALDFHRPGALLGCRGRVCPSSRPSPDQLCSRLLLDLSSSPGSREESLLLFKRAFREQPFPWARI